MPPVWQASGGPEPHELQGLAAKDTSASGTAWGQSASEDQSTSLVSFPQSTAEDVVARGALDMLQSREGKSQS